jgi:hypothetical protein
MRALLGVVLELAALAIVLYAASALANWYPFSVLALLLAQALTTVLVHCPAHYIVGRLLGIRFSGIRLGRSTAARALPASLRQVGSLLVVFTLGVDPESKKNAAASKLRAMFMAGVTGSVASAVTFAYWVSLAGYYTAGIVTWVFALAYLASDIVFSPKVGDLMRARAAMSGS